jgi:hypothetical protein
MSELMGELVRLGFLLALWAFAIWVGGASVAAWVAREKGRDPVAWFVLAFFLSPLVALIALSAIPARHLTRARAARAAARGELWRLEDPSVVAARLESGVHPEDKRWDVATSAATRTKGTW